MYALPSGIHALPAGMHARPSGMHALPSSPSCRRSLSGPDNEYRQQSHGESIPCDSVRKVTVWRSGHVLGRLRPMLRGGRGNVIGGEHDQDERTNIGPAKGGADCSRVEREETPVDRIVADIE